MVLWKIPGAEAIPNGRRLYLKRPLCVLIVVNFLESSASGTCWYACSRSRVEKCLPPAREANMSSILGSG